MQFTKKLFFLIGVASISVIVFGVFYETCTPDQKISLPYGADPTDEDEFMMWGVIPGQCTSIWNMIIQKEPEPRLTECDIYFLNLVDLVIVDRTNLQNSIEYDYPAPSFIHSEIHYPWCKNIDGTGERCLDITYQDELYEHHKENSAYCNKDSTYYYEDSDFNRYELIDTLGYDLSEFGKYINDIYHERGNLQNQSAGKTKTAAPNRNK